MPPLGIPDGGTGAGTQLGALTNLGVPMGTVEDISAGPGIQVSGGGATFQVGVSRVPMLNGGTDATNATAARSNLGAAPLASPNFTGVPRATGTAPLQTDNSDRIATTAWVTSKLTTFTAGVDGGAF